MDERKGGGRRRLLLLIAFLALVAIPAVAVTAPPVGTDRPRGDGDLVVVVHGMGRSRLAMSRMAHSLEREGYRVLNWGYSSTSDSIPVLGEALARRVAREAGGSRVHFVGHSLGNILVRWALTHHPPERVGRVVMLAPPNQGSAAADRYAPWLGWFLRPISELRTADGSTVRSLSPMRDVEFGIIAGEFDGKVSTAEAQLPGARDFVLIPAAHSFIMDRRDARQLTVRFLRSGRFGGETTGPAAP